MRIPIKKLDAEAITLRTPIPVLYNPADHEQVALADMTDSQVRDQLLDWQIKQGLIPSRLVAARTRGVCSPASILALRPTENRKAEHVEVSLTLLVTPESEEPWEAETASYISAEALSRIQVGSPALAMYEPHDPATVAMILEKETA